MDVQSIISNALIEYDTAQPVIRYIIRNTSLEGVKTSTDTERSSFKFIDKETKEVLIDTEVEILAIFYSKLKVWSWAWSQPGLLNSENFLAKDILIYALKLGSDMSYIKAILTTSRGLIKDSNQIDINLAIASSIIKQPYIYPFVYPVDGDNLIYYFILLNKADLDKLQKKN
ncbi:MAG: hypothetical protein Satyrvirus4_20 [Satyrvirus sp.]|uniref:Uncharacterized protein n=1 Tax=Satyrvirus sp. TaxID=2487771 RepID=A0A3G5AGY1_9VIRU|nr:MAG: hypothetical protein Satyrvirus4_20 [Satyrvirus sp.]